MAVIKTLKRYGCLYLSYLLHELCILFMSTFSEIHEIYTGVLILFVFQRSSSILNRFCLAPVIAFLHNRNKTHKAVFLFLYHLFPQRRCNRI
jgi:hypothetical protein